MSMQQPGLEDKGDRKFFTSMVLIDRMTCAGNPGKEMEKNEGKRK